MQQAQDYPQRVYRVSAQWIVARSGLVFGWMIFRAESMEQAIGIFKAMASNEFYNSSVVTGGTYLLFGIIALAVEWLQREKQHALQFSDIRPFNYRAVRWAVYYLIIVILFIYAGTGQTFIYFQF